jgi:hypothetical protein
MEEGCGSVNCVIVVG